MAVDVTLDVLFPRQLAYQGNHALCQGLALFPVLEVIVGTCSFAVIHCELPSCVLPCRVGPRIILTALAARKPRCGKFTVHLTQRNWRGRPLAATMAQLLLLRTRHSPFYVHHTGCKHPLADQSGQPHCTG